MGVLAIVDYGMGNLRSVAKAFEHVAPHTEVRVTDDPAVIKSAERVVFPGQGAMPDCMRELDRRGLRDAVIAAAHEKPFLGICIGLQMLFEYSEEGDVKGLGVLPGTVRRFPADAMIGTDGARLKVPQIGWNEVHRSHPHPMWEGIEDGARFYFVHSYYVEAGNPDLIAAYTMYPFPYTSAVEANTIFAVQFHPEKSQAAGLSLLGNFALWNGATQSFDATSSLAN